MLKTLLFFKFYMHVEFTAHALMCFFMRHVHRGRLEHFCCAAIRDSIGEMLQILPTDVQPNQFSLNLKTGGAPWNPIRCVQK